jgi:hypothetical protein
MSAIEIKIFQQLLEDAGGCHFTVRPDAISSNKDFARRGSLGTFAPRSEE